MFSPEEMIGEYRLVSILGTGGMGEVWLAEKGGERFAVKIPTDPDYMRQLHSEGKLQQALDHENRVKVLHSQLDNDPPFVVMEYVEGRSLRDMMTAGIISQVNNAPHDAQQSTRSPEPEPDDLLGMNFGMDIDAETPFPTQSSSEYVSPAPPRKRRLWPVVAIIVVLMAAGGIWYNSAHKSKSPSQQRNVIADQNVKEEQDTTSQANLLESAQAQFKALKEVSSTEPADTDAAKTLATRWADYIKQYSDTGYEIEKAKQTQAYFANWTPGPKLGDVRIIDLGDGVKLEMVYVRGGTFQMGSPDSERDRESNEGPVHPVELDGFWMGKFEVTQEQYESIMRSNPSHFKGSKNPVERVSWNDAKSFCDKLSQKTGQTFRLPTEAEWEYACRAGSSTAYCFGDDVSQLADYAWYVSNSGRRTHPVGGKRPNAWGLYDMHGNVCEWCGDWYASDYYENSPSKNPTGPASGNGRMLRGGGWDFIPCLCRSAFRSGTDPSYTLYGRFGFRVVGLSLGGL